MNKLKIKGKKHKKLISYLFLLGLMIVLLILTIDYYQNAPMRECITEVQNNEANLSNGKAKDICQKILELNSI